MTVEAVSVMLGTRRNSWRLTWGLLALLIGLPTVGLLVSKSRTSPGADAIRTFRGPPLAFEANRGQTDPRVAFVARGVGHTVFVTPGETVLRLTRPGSTGIVLRLMFAGANPRPRVVGLDELPGKANYFVGQDPTRWHPSVPRYGTVQYTGLYPGIDLRYSGDGRHVAYEFVVRPGADPRRIVFSWQGVDSLEVDAQGDLQLHTAAGLVRHGGPVISQRLGAARREISGRYVRTAAHEVGLDVAPYDVRQPLVITSIVPLATTAPRALAVPRRSPITPITTMR
jgi:hypothetical protein